MTKTISCCSQSFYPKAYQDQSKELQDSFSQEVSTLQSSYEERTNQAERDFCVKELFDIMIMAQTLTMQTHDYAALNYQYQNLAVKTHNDFGVAVTRYSQAFSNAFKLKEKIKEEYQQQMKLLHEKFSERMKELKSRYGIIEEELK